MLVRIRFDRRRATGDRVHTAALALASLLTPLSLAAFTMGLWSIAADLRWTGGFAFSHGVFSHWEVWLSGAAILLLVARLLNRYGGADSVSKTATGNC
ncbi:MAG TPA: hypothetical protein VH325_00820 [Bryobacteraceae bacterium]|jgi:hypothetical protein|nr:hypothetical protein [Bryobacteraceae bacterium]